ncbi:TniQ family protein [Acinetobacter soli]|jgi:predicted HTH domain antitoxin|uniref:TniQ family protein n=1 Tax=Acinetobacter TaxID=469 RepID=UPI000B3C720C|nr:MULTISPECIES: helix-turn-helix domain-containing protein [Acinetobacter]AVN19372.1 hypothetical protein C6N19_16360 [Acinetobacter pittii]MCO8055314.1 TniQ family protein [Acinetobacter towneri]MQZ40128.1 hypothetical protein [Acinetobacter nosocomialis]RZH36577.1 hypothetical protein EXD94_18190 [Acinetobacter pittii]
MKKLSLSHTPIPFSDEFIAGFFLRASYINGYNSPNQMLNSYGIPIYGLSYEAIFTDENKIKQAVEYLNFPPNLIELVIRKVPPTFQHYFWTNNQIVNASLLTILLNTFCPICLNSNRYWKKDWLLKPLTVCLDHQVNLITNCPECHQHLPIDRRSLFECPNCNFDLRTHKSTPSTVDDIETNNWFLENLYSDDESFIKIFFDIWIALFEYFSNLDIQVNKSYLLKLCHIFFHNEDIFISSLIKEIEKNLDYAHPQIQLLPFSKNKPRFKSILTKVQSQFSDYRQFSAQPIDKKFNKNESIHILGVSFRSFHKRLKEGILYHDQLGNHEKNSFSAKILEDWLINDTRNINGTYEYQHPPQLADESNHYYTIPEIMKILGLNDRNTRLFLKIPDIPTTKKYLNRYTQFCLAKEFVNDFHKKYIFLGPLAKYLGVSTLTLRYKLSSLKIDPIYSNKLYPAYYARKDIHHLDKSMIESIVTFKNNLGRKKAGTVNKSKNNAFVSLNEAAHLLSISPSQTAQLIQYKWLQVENLDERPYRIPRRSIDKLIQQKNDPSFVDIEVVLKALNCSYKQLQKNWIMTGYLKLWHIGYWQLFSKTEFNNVLEIHKEFFTASEANSYLGMHRTHITNLVSRGLIKPHFYGNKNYSIRLFKKEDVKRLLKEGYGVQTPLGKS